MENITEQNLINEISEITSLTPEEKSMINVMMEAGLFYGLSRSKTNPKMKPYLSSTKSGIEIINLIKTLKSLDLASEVIKQKIKVGGLPLVVGTTPAVKTSIKEMGKKFDIPYVTERWLGGTLTNFKTITARVQHLKKLRSDKESGKLEKYTKKERLNIEKEMAKLEKLFSGLETMDKMPSVVIIFNLTDHKLVAKEARRMKVTSIAVSNTNADPEEVDYPIVSNDRNIKSVDFIASYLGKAIEDGKKEALEAAKAAEAKKEISDDKS